MSYSPRPALAALMAALLMTAVTGCSAEIESGSDHSQDIGAPPAEFDLPPADTDCIAVANEYTLAFGQLYRDYLQPVTKDLALTVNEDQSKSIYFSEEGMTFYPVLDDNIKCCDDLKAVLCEYITDEYAGILLESSCYRDIDGALYRIGETGLGTPGKATFGCYINDCALDGGTMTADFIIIGGDNEDFDFDREIYCRGPEHDTHFTMTLIWESGKWLISDSEFNDDIGFAYRPEITESMHQ